MVQNFSINAASSQSLNTVAAKSSMAKRIAEVTTVTLCFLKTYGNVPAHEQRKAAKNLMKQLAIAIPFRSLLVLLLMFSPMRAVFASSGLTIITHGFQPPAPVSNGALPNWVNEMGNAILNRIDVRLPIYRVRFDKDSKNVVLQDGKSRIDMTATGGAIVLLDWVGSSNEFLDFKTQFVADKFFDFLRGQSAIFDLPIHLVGHSRGASVNARIAYRLAEMGILIEQITTIDPHPVTGTVADDWKPVTYINTLFADNYYRTLDSSLLNPIGYPVPGAFNVNLDGIVTGGKEHEKTHTYYHGTIDHGIDFVDGQSVLASWYELTDPRDETGYSLSRLANERLNRERSGINQYLSGENGKGSRVILDSGAHFWPNAGFFQRSGVPTSVIVGQSIDFKYYYSDRRSSPQVKFYLDSDVNPYSGLPKEIGAVSHTSRPGGSIGVGRYSWSPTAGDVGTHYVMLAASNDRQDEQRTRFDHYLTPIVVKESQTTGAFAPTVVTLQPIFSPGLVRLAGQIDSNGGSSILVRRFEWAAGDWGSGMRGVDYDFFDVGGEFTAELSTFAPGKTYRYRAWARNGSSQYGNCQIQTPGWQCGNIVTFSVPNISGPAMALSGNLNFGEVAVGSTVERTMSIANVGKSDLRVTSLEFATGFSGNWSGGRIAAGAVRNVTVEFSPQDERSYGGTVTVRSDAPSDPDSLECSGRGVSSAVPVLYVSIDEHEAGPGSGDLGFVIGNDGEGNLDWSASSSVSWLRPDTLSGSLSTKGRFTLHITREENPTSAPREGLITITASGAEGSPRTVIVRQSVMTFLKVMILPPEAVTAGAQWQIPGFGSWRNSGSELKNIPMGTYDVEFSGLEGWTNPAPQRVSISVSNPQIIIESEPYTRLDSSSTNSVYTLTVIKSNGMVAKSPAQESYAAGSQVVLAATPNIGYEFSHWSGDAAGSLNPLSVKVDKNLIITANFRPILELVLAKMENGLFRFTVNGKFGSMVELQLSPDLKIWSPFATNVIAVEGSVLVIDPQAPVPGARYYRAKEQPFQPLTVFQDDFERSDSSVVANGWMEADNSMNNDLFSIRSNALRLYSLNQDQSGYIRFEGGNELAVRISFRLDVVKNNGKQAIQIGVKGDTIPKDNPYRDCFGFAILPGSGDGKGVQPNDRGFEGSASAFNFEQGVPYFVELSILQDASREIRVWPTNVLRPNVPTAVAPSKAVVSNGTKFQIGFDSGGSEETEFLIDEFRVEEIGQ